MDEYNWWVINSVLVGLWLLIGLVIPLILNARDSKIIRQCARIAYDTVTGGYAYGYQDDSGKEQWYKVE